MTAYANIAACRICGSDRLESVLSLGDQALTGVFPRQREEPVLVGPLELVRCTSSPGGESCGLVQLRQSYDPNAMYGENYGYRSGLNQSMVDHLRGIVDQALSLVRPGSGDLVIDIGSNDATTLRHYPEDLELVGVDPTGKKFARFYPPHVRLVPDFFRAELVADFTSRRRAKIVTSIAMFYDLERPLDFMREVREVLDEDGIWIFEQSYLPAMLRQTSYDTICHEHLNYYSIRQIEWMAARAGLRLIDAEVNAANGGSFRLVAARQESRRPSTERPARLLDEEQAAGLGEATIYERFRSRVQAHREELIGFVRRAAREGKSVYGYGASTKGNVLLQYCGLTAADILAIAEVNEDKFGAFTPGTRIPIRSEHEVRASRPDYMLVLPWHFREGIVAREADYLARGGRLVFPLPDVEVVSAGGVTRFRDTIASE